MKIAHLTDTHLNFFVPEVTPKVVIPAVMEHRPDAVLITGDISDAHRLFIDLEELERLPVPLFFVAGNHDFYGSSMADVRRRLDKHAGYLTARSFVELTPRTALVGHDGWYDGEHGNWHRAVLMNDWLMSKSSAVSPQTRSATAAVYSPRPRPAECATARRLQPSRATRPS